MVPTPPENSVSNFAIGDISFSQTFSKLYFTELNFICYNALSDTRYLSDDDVKDQIQNEVGVPYFESPGRQKILRPYSIFNHDHRQFLQIGSGIQDLLSWIFILSELMLIGV